MNFLSQIFPERSTHRDGLDLFLGFRVRFQKGDITMHYINTYSSKILMFFFFVLRLINRELVLIWQGFARKLMGCQL